MKRLLITGANGFIGKNLVEYFSGKYQVLCPNRKELNLLDEKSVKEYLDSQHVNIVIHSAIQGTLGMPKEYENLVLENNLRMFFNLERCQDCFEKMYYFGSGAEYGKDAYLPLMNEDYFDHNVPVDYYGFSKYIMSKITKQSKKIFDLRLFGVFGPYENYNYRFISNIICKAIEGKEISIRQNIFFDYLYIKDLCRIMEWFIENTPLQKHYNICTGEKIDIASIAHIVKNKVGNDIKIRIEQEGLRKEYTGDNSRLLAEMGQVQFTPIENAIEELIQYYKKHPFHLEGTY